MGKIRAFLFITSMLLSVIGYAQEEAEEDLFNLSLKELMNLERNNFV